MQVVIFAGSGFSAPFGLPTMNTFFPFAQHSSRLNEDEKTFINQLILEARGANSFLQTLATNLEDVLSLAVMKDRLDIKDRNEKARGPKIEKILEKVFSDPVDINNYWRRYAVLGNFLNIKLNKREHQLSIITTNYDINIESAFLELKYPVNPIIKCIPMPESRDTNAYGHLYSQNGIHLYKLHGSVNWYKCDKDNSGFYVDAQVVSVMNASGNDSLPMVSTTNHSTDLVPVIIPPSFMKPEFHGPMRAVWSKSALVLGQAEVLAFIGYSFPHSDTEMKFFLSSSLVNNPRLRKILIIDPYADTIANRLKDPLSGFGSHFKDMLVPLNKSWTEAKLDIS